VDEADPTSGTTPPGPLTEDQRKHLDFIQAVIARLASSSAAVKGWGLTVATFVFGFAATQAVPAVAGLGMLVVTAFGLLDSYYLREERLFRCLYNAARKGQVEVYSMQKDEYAAKCNRREVVCSWSVIGFYVPLVIVGGVTLVWAALS